MAAARPAAGGDDPLQWWREVAGGATRARRGVSLELRWFGQGEPPPALLAVTGDAGGEERTDRYARCGRDDLGLKVRGSRRVGLKQRRCRVPVVPGLPPAERWSRRSARVRELPPVTAGWVPVVKRRSRLVLDLSGPQPVVPGGRRRGATARGGALEVVRLDLPEDGLRLWSVACEAWGPGDVEALRQLLRWAPVDWVAVDRSATLAGGYPALLLQARAAR